MKQPTHIMEIGMTGKYHVRTYKTRREAQADINQMPYHELEPVRIFGYYGHPNADRNGGLWAVSDKYTGNQTVTVSGLLVDSDQAVVF